MTDIIEDGAIMPVLAELKACLCAELKAQGNTTMCFCGILIGDGVPAEFGDPLDGGCCGAGYVRLNNAFPSTQFPVVDQEATCMTTMAYDISVGILRCAPIGDSDGNPPTQEEMDDYAHQALADMATIRRVLRCCLSFDKFPDLDQWVGLWTPIANDGGIGGGEQQVIIGELI